MKSLICLLLVATCNIHQGSLEKNIEKQPFILTLQEAQRILGTPASLKESTDITETSMSNYKSIYSANAIDPKTNKTGTLYYVYDNYKSEAEAKQICEEIRVSNQNHLGFEKTNNFGDEAYFHTDKQNFYLIIARKGNKVIRFKVNKVTSTTSPEELKNVAREVLSRI